MVTGVPSVNPCALVVVTLAGLPCVIALMLLLTPPTNAAIVSCPLLFLVMVMLPPATSAISLLFPFTSESLKLVVDTGTVKS